MQIKDLAAELEVDVYVVMAHMLRMGVVVGSVTDEIPVGGYELAVAKQLLDEAHAALRAYDIAALKFINKVERGSARSTETYNDLKAALQRTS